MSAIHPEAPVAFRVAGVAKTKGTLISGVRKNGTRYNRNDNRSGQMDWKARVSLQASVAMRGRSPLAGPVRLEATFAFVRPASHYGTGKNADVLKQPSTPFPSTHAAGDADKLWRNIGDALSGIVYVDDCQVTTAIIRKRWASEPGVEITVQPEPEPQVVEVILQVSDGIQPQPPATAVPRIDQVPRGR